MSDASGAKSNILQNLDQFNHASLPEHFLDVLAALLRPLPVVYMIVQLEAIDPHYAEEFFPCLQTLVRKLSDSGSATVLRILLLSWSPKSFLNEDGPIQPLKLWISTSGAFDASSASPPREADEELKYLCSSIRSVNQVLGEMLLH
jgi:hypothetical protein